jgi:hypothetical protein
MAEKRGRVSAADLSIVTPLDAHRKPLEPPANLQPAAKTIFHEIVASVDPTHFRKADVPLVAQLATATFLAKFYADKIGHDDCAFKFWSETVKLQISLSTKLRLTPQSRYDARKAGREPEPSHGLKSWENY